MNAASRNDYPYKAVRKDLLDAICKQFAPARPQTALAAAAAACEKLTPDERRELAIEAERVRAKEVSEIAIKKFKGWKPSEPAQS